MKSLDIELERFAHTGGIDGDGASRLLGRPKLEPLPLLVRESVQNSWDARTTGDGPVYIDIHLTSANPRQMEALRTTVFPEVPSDHRTLKEWLAHSREHRMLWVSDRGTVGLRGPTRADMVDEAGDRNFSDLVRNLGRDQSLAVGGGTYGYGKSALFRASGCSTVIFYTRIRTEAGYESRLMIASWIGRFAMKQGAKKVPLTGRMWWGRRSPDSVVDPLLDGDADAVAEAMGATGFVPGTTGTTIGILSPDLGQLAPADAINEIISSILWHCWPKMVDLGEGPQISFSVRRDSVPVEVPAPESCPPLDAYANALRLALSQGETNEPGFKLASEVVRQRPRTRLGRLGLSVIPRRPRRPELCPNEDPHPVAVLSHHIALMRMPKLVVSYLPCSELPSDMIEYGAAFVADADLERVFADSEPPSHDDWRPELLLDGDARSCVRVAMRRIQEQVTEFLAPPDSANSEQKTIGLGAFSMMLGGLVSGLPGGGAENPFTGGGGGVGGGGGGGGGRTPRGRILMLPATLLREGRRLVALIPFDAAPAAGQANMRLRAEVEVGILDGASSETEPPIGEGSPQVIGWLDPQNRLEASGIDISIPRSQAGRWHLKIAIPDDVQILANIRVLA